MENLRSPVAKTGFFVRLLDFWHFLPFFFGRREYVRWLFFLFSSFFFPFYLFVALGKTMEKFCLWTFELEWLEITREASATIYFYWLTILVFAISIQYLMFFIKKCFSSFLILSDCSYILDAIIFTTEDFSFAIQNSIFVIYEMIFIFFRI